MDKARSCFLQAWSYHLNGSSVVQIPCIMVRKIKDHQTFKIWGELGGSVS